MQLVFEIRNLPVIRAVPQFPPVKIPRILVKPLIVISFESTTLNVVPEKFQYQWLQIVIITISSIRQLHWTCKAIADTGSTGKYFSIDTLHINWRIETPPHHRHDVRRRYHHKYSNL